MRLQSRDFGRLRGHSSSRDGSDRESGSFIESLTIPLSRRIYTLNSPSTPSCQAVTTFAASHENECEAYITELLFWPGNDKLTKIRMNSEDCKQSSADHDEK